MLHLPGRRRLGTVRETTLSFTKVQEIREGKSTEQTRRKKWWELVDFGENVEAAKSGARRVVLGGRDALAFGETSLVRTRDVLDGRRDGDFKVGGGLRPRIESKTQRGGTSRRFGVGGVGGVFVFVRRREIDGSFRGAGDDFYGCRWFAGVEWEWES